MTVRRMLPSTGTGRRPSSTSDSRGGWLIDDEALWPIVADSVACKYDPGSEDERIVGQQEREELTGRLFVLLEVDIERGDRWTLADGRRLEVLAVEQPGGRSISGMAGGQQVARVLELQPDNAA